MELIRPDDLPSVTRSTPRLLLFATMISQKGANRTIQYLNWDKGVRISSWLIHSPKIKITNKGSTVKSLSSYSAPLENGVKLGVSEKACYCGTNHMFWETVIPDTTSRLQRPDSWYEKPTQANMATLAPKPAAEPLKAGDRCQDPLHRLWRQMGPAGSASPSLLNWKGSEFVTIVECWLCRSQLVQKQNDTCLSKSGRRAWLQRETPNWTKPQSSLCGWFHQLDLGYE